MNRFELLKRAAAYCLFKVESDPLHYIIIGGLAIYAILYP